MFYCILACIAGFAHFKISDNGCVCGLAAVKMSCGGAPARPAGFDWEWTGAWCGFSGRQGRRIEHESIFIALGLLLHGSLVLAADRLHDIKARGELRCAFGRNTMASLPQSQVWCGGGVDADMAVIWLPSKMSRMKFIDSNFAKLKDDLLGNRCDVGMFAVAVTPARQAVMDFTNRICSAMFYAVASRSNAIVQSWLDIDRPGRVVAVAAGTFTNR